MPASWTRWAQALGVIGGTVLLHEVAHAVAARRAGGEVREVGIGFGPTLVRTRIGGVTVSLRAVPVGGFAAIDVDRLPPDRRIPVLLAGPLANIAVGLILRGLARTVQPVALPGQAEGVEVGGLLAALSMLTRAAESGPVALARTAATVNISVGLANLLPVLPLDGGHLAVAQLEAAGAPRSTLLAFRQITTALFFWFAARVMFADLARLRRAQAL
ncbi:MAG: site-2 protease family protein [Armatimonadetes bacterium]|nr:site-2 protease family protein [Armatimonadota bacterium]